MAEASEPGAPGVPQGASSVHWRISRRGFLGAAAATAGAATSANASEVDPTSALEAAAADLAARRLDHTTPTPDLQLTVERDTDLLLLDFLFYGFTLDKASHPHALVPKNSRNVIVVRFPPQAIGEAAYLDPQPSTPKDPIGNPTQLPIDPPPVLSAVSGPSQLAFTLQPGQRIALKTMTAADLLDWSSWTLTTPVVAQVKGLTISTDGRRNHTVIPAPRFPYPSAPGPYDTAIEFPYAMYLAPTVYVSGSPLFGFTTSFTAPMTPAVSPAGVGALAATVLHRVGTIGAIPQTPQVSAVWARDLKGWPSVTNDVTPETRIFYGQQIK